MLVNFTNHPCSQWSESQKKAAERYGSVVDLAFPQVDPGCDEAALDALALQYAAQLRALAPDAVLCQGEFTLAYRVTRLLLEEGIPVLAACTRRRVQETISPDGSVVRHSIFVFERFRCYGTPGAAGRS